MGRMGRVGPHSLTPMPTNYTDDLRRRRRGRAPAATRRWTCGLATGYVTVAFLLTALHTAPLPREFLGFSGEKKNFFGIGADRQ